MPIDTTSTAGAPYFDDWSASGNSAKNYLKILFQPGRSVQARELNQIQSGIQSQIDKFGSHLFKEGSPIIDGEINIDNKVQYIDLTLTANGVSAASDASRPLIGKEIYADAASATPATNPSAVDVKAVIVDYENITDNDYRIYLRYTSSTTTFDNGSRAESAIKVGTAVGTYLSQDEALSGQASAVDASYAVKISNTKGIYFVKGYFVETQAQAKYVTFTAKKTAPVTNLNGKVGFLVVESNKTAVNDSTLYDNATGAPNYSAPGADRYTITLDLAFITTDAGVDSTPAYVVPPTTANLIDSLQVNDSKIYATVETKYNILGERLAQRTFEESGDYTLQPFQLDLREHLKIGGNRGKFTAGAQGGSADKFIAAIEPSIAYVKGKRVEVQSKQEIVVDKGRNTTLRETGVKFQAKFGNYIEVDTITFLPKADGTTTYTLFDAVSGGGNNLGTCNIRGIEYTGQIYRIYLTNLSLGSNLLRSAKSITGAGDNDGSVTFIGNADAAKRVGFALHDTDISNEIFSLPSRFVKTLEDSSGSVSTTISIPERKVLQNTATTGSATGADTVVISAGSDVFYHDNPNEYIITAENDGAVFPCTGVTLASNNAQATLAFTNDGTTHVDVIASVRTTATKKTKTKAVKTVTVTLNCDSVGQSVNIGTSGDDAINIFEAKIGSTEYVDFVTLDNGQTATSYGQPKMILSKLIPGVTGNQSFTVKFCHFTHSASGSGFFSVNSYPNVNSGTSTNSAGGNVARQEITAPTGVSLLDCLDFRDGASIDPNGTIEIGSLTAYLSRHDRICLRSTGELEYVEGDALGNAPAEIPDDSLLLYDLELPPYVSSVADIEIGYTDNRRYTMRDIGKIDRRVKNLEYYSSLSLLEQSTKDKQIFDNLGERFKNGILVDEFKGFSVANTQEPAYAMAMEPERGILRPTFTGKTFSMYLADNTAADNSPAGSTPMGAHDHVRLKASSFSDFINQPFASTAISVNPFDVASWVGELEISPKSDEWKDITKRPDVIVKQDQVNEAILGLVNDELASQGIRWNDWETTWTGEPKTTSLGWFNSAGAKKIFGKEHKHQRNCNCGHRNTFTVPAQNGGTLKARVQNGEVQIANVSVDSKQIREGMSQFATLETVTESLGERVVDVSFVPFIRSRKLYFRALGLKPNTVVKAFFDGIDVSDYTVPTAFVEFRDDSTRTDHTDDSPGNISSATLTTSDAGTITGYIVIPNNSDLRFRTGERDVIIADATATAAGELDLANARTYAKTQYSARGLLQTTEETVLSTQRIQINDKVETQERTVNTVLDTVATKVRHRDPLAQTFLIDGDLYPGGVFLKDIDLYFRELDDNLPVRIYLASTETGIPTQRIIPFSEVQKYPSRELAVAAGVVANGASNTEKDKHVAFGTTDASRATTFTFKSPIYLKPGTEYAVVVLSNSPNYTLWHSEVGGTDVTAGAGGQRITKNPYTGVALKSANASTWTPDQSKDFKFTIRKFNFATGSSNLGTNGYSSQFTTILPAGVSASSPLKISSVNLLATTIKLPKTGISFNLALNGTNHSLTPGRALELPSEVTIDAASDMVLTTTLTTQDSNLTPMLDVNRLTVQTFSNVINKPTGNDEVSRGSTGEAVDGHGKATARYITKTTELANAASQIDMFLDVKRPSPDCDVFAFARFDGSGSYVLLDSADIPVSTGFTEVSFTTSTTSSSTSFSSFEIKIVMVSDDIAVIPQCKNLRVIATA